MKPSHSETQVQLQIVLIAPPQGVDFGLQEGKGNDYTAIQIQRAKGNDLTFTCSVTVKDNQNDGQPTFLGPFVQGPTTGRFLYLDIGKLTGQTDTEYERRIKVPLIGITWEMIEKVSSKSHFVLVARVPGTGRDGGPSCGTVQPSNGWLTASVKTRRRTGPVGKL